jgi:hypothetical protein
VVQYIVIHGLVLFGSAASVLIYANGCLACLRRRKPSRYRVWMRSLEGHLSSVVDLWARDRHVDGVSAMF